ncbi:acyl-CoA thioesterase [Methanococcoides sp.]|uniref:acyl-CoA thioesterase n=1 Tax=Methanococcoides sp. TaxID=1966350 RepID=UPI00272DF3E3|nr:thioesterase family protein [Methanococcoides sp.]
MFKATVTPGFGEINGMKNANNNAISIWFEKARNPIFRLFIPDLDLNPDKWKLIMVRAEFDYVGEMFYGEDVEIRTFITRIGNSSFTVGQEAWQNGKLGTKGQTVIVHYDYLSDKTIPIPASIKKLLEEHMEASDKASELSN